MAHAAPRSRVRNKRSGTPDIFSAQAHRIARFALPVVLGLVYGYWAAANRRYGGPITGWNLLFGFLTALAFIVLYLAVQWLAPRMKREVHAALWGAFTAASVGFLVSTTNYSVLWSMWLGLASGAALTALLFYRFHSREDAAGHRRA
ncbi:hypothetical protein ABZ606_16965 [Streptomyces sp. NPDC012461]|jgi:hypothetical protein|uniref:Uncharacterized protein n=2 Tax=unclassified Streptomyces TaxID=2593676 RepID=A0A6G3R4X9_9ACTN|nr:MULTISPECIES: hypothetical protein [unclassified Streptomyces]NEA90487.1 hypothetical protein [Streptomyces sp. SID14436]NEC79308.1 hypothetical protein [Streptomyces sp. SID7958]NED18963.1 hypothetical protein [Streptomyces sp. SID9913]